MTLRSSSSVLAFVSVILISAATGVGDQIPQNPDLVYVNVNVTDSRGRYVAGLPAGSFKLFEDKKPQSIAEFTSENTPVSAVILLDVRENLKNSLSDSINAAFSMDGARGDQFFKVETGKISLHESLYQGLETLQREGSHQRRIVLLFTDRNDAGVTSFVKVKEFLKRQGIQLYVVGVPGLVGLPSEQGREVLRDLTNVSGGKSYFPSSMIQIERIASDIARNLRHQYRIGYRPSTVSADGKWRNIRITAELPDLPSRKVVKYAVRARTGYYEAGK